MNPTIVAICYDFDKTLSPNDMLIVPKVKYQGRAFWEKSNIFARDYGMDKILAYMMLLLAKTNKGQQITKDDFYQLGKKIELFPGVDSWFDRINEFAILNNIKIEHYIISGSLKEILQGTSIARFFTEIYASTYYYNAENFPLWPSQVVNYTTKTQYLFRISKNCLDMGDEESVNLFMPIDKRRIPFRNFIYLGDSETDIPAMQVVKQGGGTSIGVYDPKCYNINRVRKLYAQNRIDFFVPADYREGSCLDIAIKEILINIHHKN